LGKKFYNSLCFGKKKFNLFKNKIIYNFMIFVAAKKSRLKDFPLSSFSAVNGSGIRDPGWTKIRIRDPGKPTSRIRNTGTGKSNVRY
jgi:hypothetical protein